MLPYKIIPILIVFLLLMTGCQPPEEPYSQVSTNRTTAPPVDRFITVEQYLLLHPGQRSVSEQFSAIVHQTPRPIVADQQDKPLSIAFVYPGEQASDYWQRSVQSFVARMDELNIDYQLNEYFSKGGSVEIRKQEQQLKEALDRDPDYLVFTLAIDHHQRLIERILARGRPRLILQNITTPLSVWEGNQPFYVGFDHALGTRMLADYFLQKEDKGGRYGLLYYSRGYVSTMRGDSFVDFMRKGNKGKKSKKYELAAAYYTDGQRERAYQAAAQLIAEEQLPLIYACSTDVALGAVDAVRDAGLTGRIMINGWGGGSAELAALAKGELEVTVMRMNDDNGIAMAEAIRLRLLGREDEIPTVFSGDFALITGKTSAEDIRELKEHAFRYSGMPGM